EIVKFHAGIIFRRRTGNAVCCVHRDAVNKAESDTSKLRECAFGEIRHADDRQAAKASIAATQHCLIGLAIECDGRRYAAKIIGVLNLDDWPERISRDVGAEHIGDELPTIIDRKYCDVRASLGAAHAGWLNEVLGSDGRGP